MGTYDRFLMPQNSPITMGTPPNASVPWEFGIKQKYQGKQIRLSSITLRNFIQNSQVTSGTFGLSNGAGANLTTQITNNIPHQADPVLSLPHIGIYLGTAQVGTNQIYPTYQLTPGSYILWGGYDYQFFDGIKTAFTVQIGNLSGAAGTFFYIIQHKYITYNRGTAG